MISQYVKSTQHHQVLISGYTGSYRRLKTSLIVRKVKLLKHILLLLSIVYAATLLSQKKLPNTGIGFSSGVIGFVYPNEGYIAGLPIVQVNYVYLPQPNTIISTAIGPYFGYNNKQHKPLLPLWLTGSYLHLHEYSKKKKVHLIYGGELNVGISTFSYGSEHIRGYVQDYYKRLLVGISPQGGVWLKPGKRNFFTATASIGVSSLFLKITKAPESVHTNNILLPVGIRVNYNFLFRRKRR